MLNTEWCLKDLLGAKEGEEGQNSNKEVLLVLEKVKEKEKTALIMTTTVLEKNFSYCFRTKQDVKILTG